MLLKKLTIKNFRPFYNEQEIDFTPKDGKKIVLFEGDNGHGKSSTFLAISFVFFGLGEKQFLEDPDGERKYPHHLINTKRWKELNDGETGECSVTAHFEHESASYTFTRKLKFTSLGIGTFEEEKQKNSKLTPDEYNTNLQEQKQSNWEEPSQAFVVSKNNQTQTWDNDPVIRRRQQKTFVDTIIPEESNKYYFFDGEKIRKYTTVPPADSIKKTIEKILGIKMLDNAIADTEQLIREVYEPEIRRLSSKNTKAQQYSTDAATALSMKTAMKANIENKKIEISNLQANLEKYLSELRKNEQIEIKLNDLHHTQQALSLAVSGITDENQSLVNFYSDQFPILLTLRFLEKINSLASGGSGGIPSHIVQTAKHYLNETTCQCGKSIDEEAKKAIAEIANVTLDPLDHFKECQSVIGLKYGIDGLSQLWSDHLQKLSTHKGSKDRLTRAIKVINEGITKNAADLSDEINQLRIDHNNALQEQVKLNQELNSMEIALDTYKQQYDDALEAAQKVAATAEMQLLSAQRKRAYQFIDSFNFAKEHIVDTQKANIEKEASETLIEIAKPEMNVIGMKLDDKYTIKLLGLPTGTERYTNESPEPSEGEKQIIAMSFVLALSKYAGHERPTFIDTPFARLDKDYTNKVTTKLVQQDSQTIILYHTGEIDSIPFSILKDSAASLWKFTKHSEEHSSVAEVDL